jgi:HAD superfamily hydrolase (TIGR01484 family)
VPRPPAAGAPPDPAAIRLVALDIDGTTLNPQGHVSPPVARAIRAVLERGVLVVLCTGRSFALGVQGLGAELGLSLPAIVRNGTAVQDIRTGKVLTQHALAPHAVRAALDLMLAHGISPVVEEGPRHGDTLFTVPEAQCHPAVFYYVAEWQRTMHLAHVPAAELYQVREPNWAGGCGHRRDTERVYHALCQLADVSAYWSGPWQTHDERHFAGVAPAGTSKAAALAAFAAERGISLDEVLAVGDYLNDVEMLREVGWGVAMGHAPEAVKAVADAVVPDNTHDGAAVALERYVLGLPERPPARPCL